MTLNVHFQVNGPVVPGQPLTVSWYMFDPDPTFNPGNVTGSVYIGSVLLYQNAQPVPYIFDPDGTPYGASDPSPAPGFSRDPITIQLNSGQPGAQELYTIGTKNLTLVLTGSGPETGPWSLDVPLQVIPDDVDPSWWNWTTPQGENELWGSNNPYSVSGTLTNESQFALMTMTWTIIQIDDQGNQLQFGNGTFSQVEIGNITGITSNTITQGWEWILLGVWLINGPTTRQFTYRVQFTVQDLFGNSYPIPGSLEDPGAAAPFLSTPLNVTVNVTGWKYWAAIAAEALAFVAALELVAAGVAALTVVGDLGPAEFLAALAASLYAVASTSGAIARDPPKPSSKYKEVLFLVNYGKARKNLPISRFPGLSNFSESS